jgi:DNA (cytosine-5)-methyltransferase 1
VNELALFAGAGGGILGSHLLGWRTVCAVEWEPYAACVLVARQNDGVLPPFPIWDDIQTFDGKPWQGIVDVVSGGFPCQDISAAGKGAGIEGERSGMWGEMARIIHEVRPKFVFVENSPMLTSRGLGRVLGDLASMGFDAKWGVLGAADIGFHTPNTTGLDGGSNSRKALKKRQEKFPTPTCHNSNEKGSPSEFKRQSPGLGTVVLIDKNKTGGILNPTWVEWLMGWPLEWTDLKPLEMDKSHFVQQQHGNYSVKEFND